MELNSNQIQEINPHRYPFALVDRITDYKPGEYAKGIKCVSVNEMHFCGHFPQHHVMPGVLIVEALAQVGCIAILSKEENKGKIAFFGGINKCKFKHRRSSIPGRGITRFPGSGTLWFCTASRACPRQTQDHSAVFLRPLYHAAKRNGIIGQ